MELMLTALFFGWLVFAFAFLLLRPIWKGLSVLFERDD